QAAVTEEVEAASESAIGLFLELQGLPADRVRELAVQDSRRRGDLAVANALGAGQYRHIGKVRQTGRMLPAGTTEQDAIDFQSVALQLIPRGHYRTVALLPPRHLSVKLGIDVSPQTS